MGRTQVFLWLSLGIILWAGIVVIQNWAAPPVTMKFLLWNYETSLLFTLLGSAGVGMLLILFLWIPRTIREVLQAKKLRKELELLQAEIKLCQAERKRTQGNDLPQSPPRNFQLFWEALKKFNADQGFFLASGITFTFFICLIPLILLLLALLGTYLFSDREVFDHVERYLEGAVPFLDSRIMENISAIIQDRKVVGLVGIGGLIWVSKWVFSSLRTALNVVFQVESNRSVLRGIAADFLMIFLAGVFLLLSMVLSSIITVIQTHHFPYFPDIGPLAQFMLKYLFPFFLTFWIAFLIYKIAPNKKVPLQPAVQAALFTSLSWEIAKHLFGWYVLHLGRYSMIYGSLSALAVFFLWIYYSSAILILGGEIAFFLEKGKREAKPLVPRPSAANGKELPPSPGVLL